MALTQQDKEEMLQFLITRGKSLGSLDEGDSNLSNKYLAPVLEYSGGTASKAVRLAVSQLKGDSAYQDWVKQPGNADKTLSDFFQSLKGGKGDTGPVAKLAIGTVASGETPDATITGEGPDYKLNLVLKEGEKGETGKTPVLVSVEAQSGETPSGNFTANGFDESGNPKYTLNLTLPKGNTGDTGPAPILEFGEVTTVEPSDPASATFRPNGVDPSGANKYRLGLSIPKGKSGQDGTGAGNVLVNNEASLLASKQYAFKPGQDGSVNGTFEEVVASDSKITLDLDGLGESGNGIFGSELNNYLNKLEIVQKSITAGTPYQKFKQAIIDNALPIIGKYTLDNKVRYATCSNLVIDNFSITMFGETVYITDGIKLEFNYESIKNTILFANVDSEEGALSFTSSDGLNMIYLHPNVFSLTSLSTSDEIFSSCGGKEILANTCKNLTLGMQLAIGINGMQYYLPYMVTPAYQDDDNFSLYFFLNFNNLEIRLSIAVSAGQASCEVDYLSFAYSDNRDEDGLYVNKIIGGKIIQSKLSTALAELGGTGSFEIPSALLELTNESTSDEIKAAVGGDVGFTTFLKAVLGDCKLYIDEPNDFIREAKFRRFCDVYGAHEAIDKDDFSAIGFYIQPYENIQYFIMVGRTYDYSEYMFNIEEIRGQLVSVTPGSHQVYFKYDQYRDKLIFDHSSSGSTDGNTSYVAFSLGDAIKLLRDGDGTKALMDDGTYHNLTGVLDNLTSTNTTAALSANQGRVLKGLIDNISSTTVVNSLTSTSTTSALSAAKGKELKTLVDGKVASTEITTIKKLTQSAYDALSSKDSKTLYIIA